MTTQKFIEVSKAVLKLLFVIAKPVLIVCAFFMVITFGTVIKVVTSSIKG